MSQLRLLPPRRTPGVLFLIPGGEFWFDRFPDLIIPDNGVPLPFVFRVLVGLIVTFLGVPRFALAILRLLYGDLFQCL